MPPPHLTLAGGTDERAPWTSMHAPQLPGSDGATDGVMLLTVGNGIAMV